MDILELRRLVRDVVDDPRLTYRQRMHNLAVVAENALEPPPVSEECAEALEGASGSAGRTESTSVMKRCR